MIAVVLPFILILAAAGIGIAIWEVNQQAGNREAYRERMCEDEENMRLNRLLKVNTRHAEMPTGLDAAINKLEKALNDAGYHLEGTIIRVPGQPTQFRPSEDKERKSL